MDRKSGATREKYQAYLERGRGDRYHIRDRNILLNYTHTHTHTHTGSSRSNACSSVVGRVIIWV